MTVFEDARLRAGSWWREWRDRAEERKADAAKKVAPGGTPKIWVWFLAIIAGATLLGSTWMLLVFIAGSVGQVDWRIDWRAGNDGTPARWVWMAEANIHALIGLGLLCACIGVAAFNAVWLHVRHHLFGIFRSVVTGIGVAVALFMISGAIVVQQWGSDARTRDEVVQTQTAVAGTAAVQGEIDAITARWQVLCAPALSTWQAQACRSGAAAWQDRIAIAERQMRPGDPTLQIIQRAIADAREGDRMQARLAVLRGQHAAAAVTTVQAQAQTVQATGWMAVSAHWLEDLRKPFIAVLGELLAMTMFGVALAAHRSRQMTIEQSGWAREDQRIEDLRAEESVVSQPMQPAKEKVYDAESGEELTRVKPHWRKLKKGRPQKVDVTPDPLPDESGTPEGLDHGDGGLRSAALHGEHEPLAPELLHDGESGERDETAQSAQLHDSPIAVTIDTQPKTASGSEPNADYPSRDEVHSEPPIDEVSDEDAEAWLAAAGEPLNEIAEQHEEETTERTNADAEVEASPELHDSLLQTAPQQVADLDVDVGVVQHRDEQQQDGEEDRLAHQEPQTDPRRLIAAE
jgi:hypothetical protein